MSTTDTVDTTQALRVGPKVLAHGASVGPLAGTSTVVKDLFDVAGERTGAGNPTWLEQAPVAAEHASAVSALVCAGATVIGKAHTDELAFSLSGTNVHYGTPINPAAPDRIPGGSSSGSASAVAAGLVDYALATDTGGSTRVPASYCGIFGIRTTHGRVPVDGLVPLVPAFDTVGLLARSGSMLELATRAVLPDAADAPVLSRLVLATDVVDLADEDTRGPVRSAAQMLAGLLGVPLETAEFAPDRLNDWPGYFMARQLPTVWSTHGAWSRTSGASFGPGVTQRFSLAEKADPERAALADRGRDEVHQRLDAVLPPGGVLVYATATGPAPLIDLDANTKNELRQRTIAMTCIAGLGGLPAVSLPLATVAGLPVGLSIVARPGEDELLLAIAAASDDLTGVRNP